MINNDDYTSENVHNKITLDEIGNIIEKTQPEYNQKYGTNYYRKVKVKCIVKFLD